MTIAEALRAASERLSGTSDTARLDAELLMAHALGVSRSEMLLKHGKEVEPPEFSELVARRALHEPIAYITGHQEFFGRDFIVTPDVLIPRSDSETLIGAGLKHAPPAKRVLDMGTGSGCLLLTMLAEFPEAEGIGIDASLAATAVAAANAARLGVADRAHILHSSWLDEVWSDGLGQFDLILANPPYVEKSSTLDPSVRNFEPAQALFAGEDGLDDYKVIIPQLRSLMNKDGFAILEIGHLQAKPVSEVAANHGFSVEIRQDLGGRDRVAILT